MTDGTPGHYYAWGAQGVEVIGSDGSTLNTIAGGGNLAATTGDGDTTAPN